MSKPVYIGDEVSASGFRLAGLRVRVPQEGEYLQILEWAMEDAPLVLVSTAIAEKIPTHELDSYLSSVTPAVVIVPDVHGDSTMPDLSNRMRKQLGLQE